MRYKEAKPSNTFSKKISEHEKRHFGYRLFKFPIFFVQREIIWDGEKNKIQLDVIRWEFRIK